MKENKENAYLTCPIYEWCYSKRHGEELRKKALKTNDPSDWSKVPMSTILVDCFNMDCFMRKNYKQAMENLKGLRKIIKIMTTEILENGDYITYERSADPNGVWGKK